MFWHLTTINFGTFKKVFRTEEKSQKGTSFSRVPVFHLIFSTTHPMLSMRSLDPAGKSL